MRRPLRAAAAASTAIIASTTTTYCLLLLLLLLHPVVVVDAGVGPQDLRHRIETIPSDPDDIDVDRAIQDCDADMSCAGVSLEGRSTWRGARSSGPNHNEVTTSVYHHSFVGPNGHRSNGTHATTKAFTYHRGRITEGTVLGGGTETGLTLARAKERCATDPSCVAFTYPVRSLTGLNYLPNVTFVSTLDSFSYSPDDEYRTYVSNDASRAEFVRGGALPYNLDEHSRPYSTCCDKDDDIPSLKELADADTTLERISCDISREDFYVRYELPRRPVMLVGCDEGWKAGKEWTYDKLAPRFSNSSLWRARLGSETEDYREDVEWEEIATAIRNEERFYVFDQLEDDEAKSIEDDYEIPTMVRNADLYDEMKSRGVYFDGPLRWFVMGRFGSGTHVHNDPFATDAWNTLIRGHKWWIIYPPGLESVKSLKCDKSCSSEEPFVREWAASVGTNAARTEHTPDAYPYHVLQKPGETIYIPDGRLHTVFNMDSTIAITANYGSPANLDGVWEAVCKSDDVRKWKVLYNLVLNREQRRQVRSLDELWPPWEFCADGVLAGGADGVDSHVKKHAPRGAVDYAIHDEGWNPKVGDAVEARYRGDINEYYKGKVRRVHRDDTTFDVRYFDGDEDFGLPRRALRRYTPFKAGEIVQVLYDDDFDGERWLLAAVKKVRDDGTFDVQLSLGPFFESFPSISIRRFDWQYREGNRVEAQWENGNWHSGVVSRARRGGTYDVRFDDGDFRADLGKDLIRYEWTTLEDGIMWRY